MNDEDFEQLLRDLPVPLLPETWRGEILSIALREARASRPSNQAWPAVLIYLRNLFKRNPVTGCALSTLWMLIFLFKVSTPVDPSEKMLLAHFDPNRPIYFVSIADEIQLVQLLQDEPEQSQLRQIP